MGIKTKFMKSYSLRGEWTEARFMIRACEHGFNVSRPWGGSSRYDFVVELNGQFLRVQVKSTTWKKTASPTSSLYAAPPEDATPKKRLISSPSTSSPRTPGTLSLPAWWSALNPVSAYTRIPPTSESTNTSATSKPGTC